MIDVLIVIFWFSLAIVSFVLGLFMFILFCMWFPGFLIDIFTCHGRDSSEY